MKAFVAIAFLAAACGEEPPPADEPSVSPEEVPSLNASPRPNPWPLDLPDWRASLTHFESLPQCERDVRARVPAELAEVLYDFGYDSVVHDTCVGLQAASARDPSACDAIAVRAAREGCQRRAAAWAEAPDACPPARGGKGRDSQCLAWALRDARFCAAVRRSDQDACRAVLANDDARCDDAICEALVARYGDALASESRGRAFQSEATLVRTRGNREERETLDGILPSGIVVEAKECGYVVELEFGRELRVEAELAPNGNAGRVSIRWQGSALPQHLGDATLTLRGDLRRGETLRGVAEGKVQQGGEELQLRLEFQSWLRDVDPLPDACIGPL
ncbi:MAG: hypothetical protein AAGE52_10970 [Myxococcota bacterium]